MLHAFDAGEYNTVSVCWSAINSLLPKEYKVEINSDKYNKLVIENKIIVCEKCKEKIPYNEIKTNRLLLPTLTTMIISKTHEVFWVCPHCSFENIFDQKQIRVVKYNEPYYLEVIPDPPQRQFGISDRASFNVRFRKWFALALNEIESKIGKYRTDYIAQLEFDDTKIINDEDHEN